jgi:hypothetical protein
MTFFLIAAQRSAFFAKMHSIDFVIALPRALR